MSWPPYCTGNSMAAADIQILQNKSGTKSCRIKMRRASEASLFFLGFPTKKMPHHNGSYEHRVPKKKHDSVPGMCDSGMCSIQHRNWPLRSTILNAHGTNASPDGLCTRTRTNEAFSCWLCCNSFRVDRARRGKVCLEDQAKACSPTMVWVLI